MAQTTPLRRADKAITDPAELDRIIDDAPVLRLGVVDHGAPYVVPVNFAREGRHLWFHGADTGRKLDCLRADPGVCVEIDRFIAIAEGSDSDPCTGWTTRYESVIAFGTAEIVSRVEDKIHGLRLIMRKFSGRDDWEFAEAEVDKISVVRVELSSITGKHSPL